MRAVVTISSVLLLSACGPKFQLPDYSRYPDPLPDLRIKKVEYRPSQRQQVLRSPSGTTSFVAKLNFEFTLVIENVGNKRFTEPFYLSMTGSLTDYQEYLYSRHHRLNDEGQALEPGQTLSFIVVSELEPLPTPSRARLSHYPVRFYINTEGPANSTGFPTLFVAERSYKNNTYELQLRLR